MEHRRGVAIVVVGVVLGLLGCSSDSDPTARELYEAEPENCANINGIQLLIALEEGDDDVSDSEQEDREELSVELEEQAIALACPQPFESALRSEAQSLEVDSEGADCLSTGWLEAIGVETFIDQEVSADDAHLEGVEMTEEQATGVVEVTEECVGMATWFAGSWKAAGREVTAEIEECVAEELDVDDLQDAMVELYTTGLTDQLADVYRSLDEACPELASIFQDDEG